MSVPQLPLTPRLARRNCVSHQGSKITPINVPFFSGSAALFRCTGNDVAVKVSLGVVVHALEMGLQRRDRIAANEALVEHPKSVTPVMNVMTPPANYLDFEQPRASCVHLSPYPAALKKLRHSSGLKRLQMSPMACQSSSTVLAARARRWALSLENAISIGFRSGL